MALISTVTGDGSGGLAVLRANAAARLMTPWASRLIAVTGLLNLSAFAENFFCARSNVPSDKLAVASVIKLFLAFASDTRMFSTSTAMFSMRAVISAPIEALTLVRKPARAMSTAMGRTKP